MNDAEQAFDELLDSAAEAKGERIKVLFRGGPVEVALSSDSEDISPGSGGWSQQSSFQVSARKRDVKLPIQPNEAIKVGDRELAVLSYENRPGYVEMTVGDPSEDID